MQTWHQKPLNLTRRWLILRKANKRLPMRLLMLMRLKKMGRILSKISAASRHSKMPCRARYRQSITVMPVPTLPCLSELTRLNQRVIKLRPISQRLIRLKSMLIKRRLLQQPQLTPNSTPWQWVGGICLYKVDCKKAISILVMGWL